MRHSRFADSSEPRSRSVAPTRLSSSLERNLRLAWAQASAQPTCSRAFCARYPHRRWDAGHVFPHAAAGDGAYCATCSLSCYVSAHSCTYGRIGGRWETSNLDTIAMIKYHRPTTQVKTRGLGKNGHAFKQGPAKGVQGKASDPQRQRWLYTNNRSSHDEITTPTIERLAATLPPKHYLCTVGVKSSIYTCKCPPPLETIKGEAEHSHEHSLTYKAETWDSFSLSQPVCNPYYKHFRCKIIQDPTPTLDVGQRWPEPV